MRKGGNIALRTTGNKTVVYIHKFLYKAIILVAAVVISITFCGAEEITDEIIKYSGADMLEEYLPDTLEEYEEFSDVTITPKEENHFVEILRKLISVLTTSIRNDLALFFAICAFLIVCAVVRTVSSGMGSSGNVIDYICMICASGYCYAFVSGTLETTKRAIGEIDNFMGVMLPVMGTLYTVSGNIATAVTQNIGVYTAITLFEQINTKILMPLFNFGFGLAIVCAISNINLSGILKHLKNFIIRLCVTLLTVLISILFFQSTFSSAADTLTMRGARYAATLIPIVGALVGEAARTVAASISVIKASAGVFAVTAILYTAFVPAAILISKKFLLSLCIIIGRILGTEKESLFFEEVNGLLSILLSIVISVGIFFILAITIFIKTAVVT